MLHNIPYIDNATGLHSGLRGFLLEDFHLAFLDSSELCGVAAAPRARRCACAGVKKGS